MKRVLFIAPHPDDETLGCGGTILRYKLLGEQIFWLIVTEMKTDRGFDDSTIEARKNEIDQVALKYGFDGVFCCGFATSELDTFPKKNLISSIKNVFDQIQPTDIFVPFPGDVHSDHRIVFEASVACSKSFRQNSIKRILAYETLSETEFGLDPAVSRFSPNLFVDILNHLDEKISVMKIYESEHGVFPFPRSEDAIRSLAQVRGSQSGLRAAEAFMVLKEIW